MFPMAAPTSMKSNANTAAIWPPMVNTKEGKRSAT